MEKEDTVSVQWAQENVETSYSLLNNNNEYVCVMTSSTCNMRCTVLTAMTSQIVVVQVATPCSLENEYQDFIEADALI